MRCEKDDGMVFINSINCASPPIGVNITKTKNAFLFLAVDDEANWYIESRVRHLTSIAHDSDVNMTSSLPIDVCPPSIK